VGSEWYKSKNSFNVVKSRNAGRQLVGICTVHKSSELSSVDVPMKSKVRQLCANLSSWVINPCCNDNYLVSILARASLIDIYFYLALIIEVETFAVFPSLAQEGARKSENLKELSVSKRGRNFAVLGERATGIGLRYLVHLAC
jgi:hypothetical protein